MIVTLSDHFGTPHFNSDAGNSLLKRIPRLYTGNTSAGAEMQLCTPGSGMLVVYE
jgi:hypothetical protein